MTSFPVSMNGRATPASSRRTLVQALVGGAAIALPFLSLASNADARKTHKKQRRRKKRNKGSNDAPPPTPEPAVIADAACAGFNVSGFIVGSDGRAAQSFTAGLTGDLVRADLTLDHFSISDGEYFLRVASLVDGHPTEQVLATARIDDRTLPDGQSVVSFSFDPPAPVRAGTSYALVLSRAGAGEFTWRGDFNNSCPGRSFFSDGRSDPFEPSNQHDFLFVTFVRV
jgi:hypothetical protein